MVDNICAISTPYGVGAISIIRCSGPDAIILVNNIFKGKDLTKVKSHTIHHGLIVDNGEVIDDVVCNVYIGPKSFDGENMVEINCHGGVYVTNLVLQTLLKNGFRLAERGEFSKRAFLNHKLDLTQAESIMDVISSTNKLALKGSQSSLRKSTYNLIKKFRDKILDLLAKIEVNIDYPEYDDAVVVTNDYLLPVINEMLKDMKEILKNSEISTIAIHGIKTCIVGKPNVGKSSLLNMLLDEDKAIVSNIAGTTRDMVEGTFNLGNITLHLIDTAGIHESNDLVENIGIKKSEKALEEADLVFLVLDSSSELSKDDYELLKITENKKRIIIANKIDLKPKWNIADAIYISTVDKSGLKELEQKILEITNINMFESLDGNYLNNARQINLMQKAYDSLTNAKEACENMIDVDLIEIDIKNAFDYLGEITGEASRDELITALFTKFCLGK
ncbi:MAG: tRNA uridine-5-carboxymethylaminomethyl(34) synthesis GTPase MnmE [Acholeplasmatales bacterium]|nr:tRNA uridine-5-carboxymethylaminomethyl(34) synthesis GTPase MnmE [Acholeplasmatales bacterium]